MEVEIVDAPPFYESEIYYSVCSRLVRYKKLTYKEWQNIKYINQLTFRCPDCRKKYKEEILK